jgi:demethylmenaquinone methyltransferase/2-methoxy-6-polyprenyl-1,4-benzoquinol methylase
LERRFSPIQSYYASRAGEYDAIYRKPERQPDLREIEQWLPALLRARRILEIACGTGYWTQFLAPVASSIVAIDSAEETLRIARERVASTNVSFAIGDAYAPGLAGGPFDAAFAGFWLSHVPHERQVEFLTALNAALEPGARVVLLANLFVAGSSSPISEQDERGNTYQSRRLGDGSVHRVLKNFPSETELHALVADGLGRSPRYTRWSYYWAFEYCVPQTPAERGCLAGNA